MALLMFHRPAEFCPFCHSQALRAPWPFPSQQLHVNFLVVSVQNSFCFLDHYRLLISQLPLAVILSLSSSVQNASYRICDLIGCILFLLSLDTPLFLAKNMTLIFSIRVPYFVLSLFSMINSPANAAKISFINFACSTGFPSMYSGRRSVAYSNILIPNIALTLSNSWVKRL
jgi:hypothetical protein